MMIGNMTRNELSPCVFQYHSRNSFQASIGPPDSTIPQHSCSPAAKFVSACVNSAAVNYASSKYCRARVSIRMRAATQQKTMKAGSAGEPAFIPAIGQPGRIQPSQIGFTLVSSHFLGSSRYSLSVTGIAFVPFGNATSIEVLDSKSFRDDSRPTASMIF
jgi:hypothetical protein